MRDLEDYKDFGDFEDLGDLRDMVDAGDFGDLEDVGDFLFLGVVIGTGKQYYWISTIYRDHIG